MFYILSKILYPLVAPVSLVIIYFLLYAFLKIKSHFYTGLFLLLFFTNPYIAQHAIGIWEIEGVNINTNDKHEAIIILGGFASTKNIDGVPRPVFSDGNDRLMQTLDLYRRGVSNKIIYTAGTDSIFYYNEPESIIGKRYLMLCGIPDSAIWVETESINTYENAVFTRELLKKKDENWADKKYVIVTSAFHMRRAIACYKKAGFKNLTPYGTDFRSIRPKNTIINTIIPTYGGLENWTYLFKEIIGMFVYKIKGYL
ncbi:MAG: YdcF family protein [Bacteroidia bacterium]